MVPGAPCLAKLANHGGALDGGPALCLHRHMCLGDKLAGGIPRLGLGVPDHQVGAKAEGRGAAARNDILSQRTQPAGGILYRLYPTEVQIGLPGRQPYRFPGYAPKINPGRIGVQRRPAVGPFELVVPAVEGDGAGL